MSRWLDLYELVLNIAMGFEFVALELVNVFVKRFTLQSLDLSVALLVLGHCVNSVKSILMSFVTLKLHDDWFAVRLVLSNFELFWLVLFKNVFIFQNVVQIPMHFVFRCVLKY